MPQPRSVAPTHFWRTAISSALEDFPANACCTKIQGMRKKDGLCDDFAALLERSISLRLRLSYKL
jgi:hypothetical protein